MLHQNVVVVVFLVAPIVEPFSFAKSLHKGMRYSVLCSVTRGDSPISIRWLKDGRPLSSHASISLQTQRENLRESQQHASGDTFGDKWSLSGISIKLLDMFSSTLSFSSLQAQHRGTYSCEATNTAGSATQNATLAVNGKFECFWLT